MYDGTMAMAPYTRLGFFLVGRDRGCGKMELLQETRWEHGLVDALRMSRERHRNSEGLIVEARL